MIAADYSGQEVRVLAQVSQDKTLIESLRKGQDMHLKVANQFYDLGIPEEALYDGTPEFEEYKKKFKKERTAAKVITFGLAYGKGAFGLSKDFNCSEEEAQIMIDKYFEGMPDVKNAIDKCHKEVQHNGFVTTMAGRRRHFQKAEKGYYPGSAFRQSFNFLIQGFSADMMRKAMVMIQSNRDQRWDLKMIMTVHDECVCIARTQYIDEVKQYVKKQMESAVNLVVPTIADVEAGKDYSEIK
jgi:DNA polymerase-1